MRGFPSTWAVFCRAPRWHPTRHQRKHRRPGLAAPAPRRRVLHRGTTIHPRSTSVNVAQATGRILLLRLFPQGGKRRIRYSIQPRGRRVDTPVRHQRHPLPLGAGPAATPRIDARTAPPGSAGQRRWSPDRERFGVPLPARAAALTTGQRTRAPGSCPGTAAGKDAYDLKPRWIT